MSVSIRPAHGSDLPYLYEICLKTGFSGADAEELFDDPHMIGQYYAAPYLFFEPELCFVAEEGSLPRGYILCASDTARFIPWFEGEWLPPLRKRYAEDYPARSDFERQILATIRRPLEPDPFAAEYPAHLHIDLLPVLQGKGCGRALVDTLVAALRARGVPGLHLGVGAANVNAIAFYRKLGFAVLKEEGWGLVMGMRL